MSITSFRPNGFSAGRFKGGMIGPIEMRSREMARRYSSGASRDVKSAMERRKRGTLKSGKGGHGGKVKSRKQAIAIGLSEARKKGTKVPRKKSG